MWVGLVRFAQTKRVILVTLHHYAENQKLMSLHKLKHDFSRTSADELTRGRLGLPLDQMTGLSFPL